MKTTNEGRRTKDESLRQRLLEDIGAPDEAEQLLPTARRLAYWSAPVPTADETARLIQALQAELPTRAARSAYRIPHSAFLLLRAQMQVVRREIWAASALVMALGTLVTLATADPGLSNEALPLVFFAPIVAAIGVAFLYGPAVDPSLEIELATPVSPRRVLLARLALVFGFNLLLGLAGSVALAGLRSDISLWPLVMTWLAPMAFLSALTFLISVLFVDSLAGVALSLLLWGLQSIRQASNGFSWLAYLPNLSAADARPWLLVSALLLGGMALWIGGREDHWIGHSG